MRYAIVIENAGSNYSAYVPDLPGCVATGATIEETESSIREAIEFHLEGLREDGTPIPPPSSRVDYVEVAAQQSLEGSVRGFLLGASSAEKLCVLGAMGWRFCAAPQLHR